MSNPLTLAREALAAYDAPICNCPLGAEIDEFGSVHCPECRTVYGDVDGACPTCGWFCDFHCDRPVGHEDGHASGTRNIDAAHLRAALAEVDRLRAILACERGEWAPEGWVYDFFSSTWRCNSNHGSAIVWRRWARLGGRSFYEYGWEVFYDDERHEIARTGSSAPTALEAIEFATAALAAKENA